MEARQKFKEASIAVAVIRADGTREDHGIVSYWNRNPLRRLAWRVKKWRRS